MKTEKPSIRARLQGYMEKMTIDPFNIETQVNENVACFFEGQATKTGTAIHELFVVIKKQEQLKSWLVEKHKVHPLAITALVRFFAGSFYTSSLEVKMTKGISSYMESFANREDIPVDQLKIIISMEGATPVLHAFLGDFLIRPIALQELIKHLK